MTKFCSNCGSEINENADICLNCGVRTGEYCEPDDAVAVWNKRIEGVKND